MNKNIEIKGASTHNLKGIDLKIPHNNFVVISGKSGSGKSSLAFDTLYAEGQRRYVESLSTYIRQFLGKINKPNVDYIKELPPAIAIEQKVISNNSRSTVGTSTEVYEYMKLLFARIGKTISPISNSVVKKDNVQDVLNFVMGLPIGTECYLLSPIVVPKNRELKQHLQLLSQQGFSRIFADNKIHKIVDILVSDKISIENGNKNISILVDRVINNGESELKNRLADSVQTAMFEGINSCEVVFFVGGKQMSKKFSQEFEADGITFEEPSVNMFGFNNPAGACPKCEGLGKVVDISPELVVPDKSLSIYDNAVVCWKSESAKEWKEALINTAYKFDFPIHKPYCQLSEEQIHTLWHGNKYFGGIYQYFDFVNSQQYKIQYRVLLSRYRGNTACVECNGTRLKPEASFVKIKFRK